MDPDQEQSIRKANLEHYKDIFERITKNPTVFSESFRKMIETLIIETTNDLIDHC